MKRSCLIGVVLVLCVAAAPAQEGGSSLLSSLGIAELEAVGGQLVFARGEGRGTFGFYFWVKGKLVEVEIREPRVIKDKEIKDIPDKGPVNAKLIDALKIRTKTKLPNARYIEIALQHTGGKDIKTFTLLPVGDDIHVQIEADNGKGVTLNLTNGGLIR